MEHTCKFMHVYLTQELRQSRLYNSGQNFAFYWFIVIYLLLAVIVLGAKE